LPEEEEKEEEEKKPAGHPLERFPAGTMFLSSLSES